MLGYGNGRDGRGGEGGGGITTKKEEPRTEMWGTRNETAN